MQQNDFNSTVNFYYKSLKKYKPLSKDEESEIYKINNIKTRNKLVESHLKYVFSIAKRYKGFGVDLSSLISEGNMGLIRATETFDYTKGYKFATYAHGWIWSYIKEFINNNRKINFKESLFDDHIVNSEHDKDLIDNDNSDITTFEDKYCIDNSITTTSVKDDKRKISLLLSKLTEKEQEILTLYFGLDGDIPHKVDDISEIMGISRVRVNKLKNKALSKLRSEMLMIS